MKFESLTPSWSDEADDSDSDIELSDDSNSDNYVSHTVSDNPGLNVTSQELRDVLNSSDTDCVGVTPTTRENSSTTEEKKIFVNKIPTLFFLWCFLSHCGSAVVLDESHLPTRYCLFFNQFIPGKSHKYGYKLYKLYSPNSYTLNTQVYVGKSDNVFSFGHAESKIIELSKDLLGCS